ncbi:MAG: restriction endonuclease subunit S [Nitrospira sp.]|nr:restriction endonuclease subunit S [Nitrospira sp.]
MRNVPLMSLAEISELVQYGYTAPASDTEIGPKFLRITDIVPPQIDWNKVPYCEIDEKNFTRFSLTQGDIVIARTGATVGYAKLIRNHEPSVFASYLVRVRVDPEKADSGYVGRIIESDVYKRFVLSRLGGAAQPNANAKVLSSFRLPIPERHVQTRIASILSAYDDLIENNRRRIQLLEQVAKLLYKEWFIRLRFPGHEHVKIKDDIPDGWERKKISKVCETIGGGTPSTRISEYWDGDIPWVVPSDVTKSDSLVLLDTERKITEKGLRKSSAKIVPCETILMTSRASVGFFALMDFEVCTNQGFINIIPHKDELRMYLLFNLMSRVAEIRSNAKGTTYPEISKGRFRGMNVVVPSKTLLGKFSKISTDVIRQVRYLKRSILKLESARDLLLPRLINGEVTASPPTAPPAQMKS